MERQNLGERNILYVSSSALRRFISPKNIKRVILPLSASTSCHFIISLSKLRSTGSLLALTHFSYPLTLPLSLSVCILYPSFSFLVLSVYSFVTNFHPHTHSETVCVFTFFSCQNILLSAFIQFLQKVYFTALFPVYRNHALQISHTVSPNEVATRLG